jgi:hypothetical protein
METRHCSKCDESKPQSEWSPSSWNGGGYCRACAAAWKRANPQPSRLVDHPARQCLYCEREFKPKMIDTRFCSRSCAGKHNFRVKQASRGVSRAGRPCKNCGGEISRDLRTDRQYCSPSCGYQWNGRRSNIRKMGISPEQFDALLAAQGGTCAIRGCSATVCGNGRRLHIDHDHECCPGRWSCGECIRGLLCDRHNIAAGMLRNSADECDAMGDYLRPVRATAVA